MLKSRLFCSTIIVSAALTSAAFAQVSEPSAPVAVITQDELQPTVTVDAVIATGTRLRIPDYTSPNPTMSQSAEQIERSGDTNLIEFLTDLPAVVGSTDDVKAASYETPSLVGLNLLDLRNLGETRTLVLVNGRRHVAGLPGTSAVDINTIPTDLVERVDILTGGASAVYGADGVSGVVNFILKDNFEGTSVRAQYGDSEAGGGRTGFFSVLTGRNLAQGRANVTFNLEYYNREDVKFDDRYFTRTGVRRTLTDNPADIGDPGGAPGNGIPDLILSNNLRYIDTSPGGSIYTRYTDFFPGFQSNGDPFEVGEYVAGFIMIGGSGSLLDMFNDDLLPGVERWSTNFTGHYDFSPNLRMFGELKYSTAESDFVGQPSYDYGLFIPLDNPYVPAAARADAENDPDGFGDFVIVARDNFDLGSTTYNNQRDTYRAVLGLNGLVTDNIEFEASYVYGRTTARVRSSNNRINERFYAATDVVDDGTGNIVCRSDLDPDAIPLGDVYAQFPFDPSTWGSTFTPGPGSGCVPVNIFGDGAFSPQALDWINTDATDISRLEQSVLTAFLRGSTNWEFPTGGPVSWVAGVEYRDERSNFQPDPITLLAEELQYPVSNAGRSSITSGDFNVTEVFGEIDLPVVTDMPFIKLLALQAAYRYSDYSTAGGNDTWNAGLRWRVNDSLMFRGTVARAVRAPNVNDLFRGRDQTFEELVDPCSRLNLGSADDVALRTANCLADLGPLGYMVGTAPGNFDDTLSESVGGFISGNLALVPEEAFTRTIGLVYTPTYVPGLAVSVDYYSITIDDAINSFSAQTIVENCYDLPRPNDFCDLIERQGSGGVVPGRLSGFQQIPTNIAQFQTKGIDFTIRYRLDPVRFGVERDIGTFDFSLVGNFLDRLAFNETPNAPVELDDGDAGAPTFQAAFDTTWNYNNWEVNYGFNYFNGTRRISRAGRINEPDVVEPQYFDYAAREEHDIRVAYTYNDRYQFYGGVNNFTNQEPEFQEYIYPVSPLGRYFFVGLKASFD